jgi:hypothetical protein
VRVRPHLSVLVDRDSLQNPASGRGGGEAGWAGPLARAGCRRLAGDGAVTRVLVTRQPPSPTTPAAPTTTPGGPDDGHGHPGHHPRGPGGPGDPAGRAMLAASTLPTATPAWPSGSRQP